jgi:hypothetical protein
MLGPAFPQKRTKGRAGPASWVGNPPFIYVEPIKVK